MAELCAAAISGDLVKAREIQFKLFNVHQMLFVEANPIPVKWALHQMGKMSEGIRLPLLPLSENFREPLRLALKDASLLV